MNVKHPMSFGEFKRAAGDSLDGPDLFRAWLLYCAHCIELGLHKRHSP